MPTLDLGPVQASQAADGIRVTPLGACGILLWGESKVLKGARFIRRSTPGHRGEIQGPDGRTYTYHE
jgi:hypothetical protein